LHVLLLLLNFSEELDLQILVPLDLKLLHCLVETLVRDRVLLAELLEEVLNKFAFGVARFLNI
jgi:hypothetical protein